MKTRRRNFQKRRSLAGGVEMNFHGYGDWEIGDYVIGEYLQSVNVGKYKTKSPLIKVIDCHFSNLVKTKDGTEISNEDMVNKNLVLNGSGSVKYAFFVEDESKDKKPVEPMEIVEVIYQGKMDESEWHERGKDGEPPHKFEINIVEETVTDEEETEDDEDFDL